MVGAFVGAVGVLVGGTMHICGPVLLKSHSPSCLHLMESDCRCLESRKPREQTNSQLLPMDTVARAL